jgi:hypothetical protein
MLIADALVLEPVIEIYFDDKTVTPDTASKGW